MDRDPQFEIQYLLSLIIAVLGLLEVDSISQYVPIPTAHLLLLMIFSHISIFNIVYTLKRATKFELAEINTIDSVNRITLYGVTVLFCYLIVSVISVWTLYEALPFSESQADPIVGFFTYGTFFAYAAPAILIVMMSGAGWRKIMPSLRQARDIEVSIVPEQISVFHEFDSTRPLHVNIENETSNNIDFTTIVKFPDDVEWRHREVEQGSGTFTDDVSVPSGGHEPYNLELRYQGTERKTAEVDVIIIKDEDTFTDQVILTLEEF
jgi:hypothetical protein